MPEFLLLPLFFACLASVPVAGFVVGVLFARCGFRSAWTFGLNMIAFAAALGALSLTGIFGGSGAGPAGAGIATVFASAILITAAATFLAFRKWPEQG